MKAAILIAVRTKSARLPRKALAEIEGKPLIEHMIDRLKMAKIPESIMVCTSTHRDDKILVNIAERNEVKWFTGSENDVLRRFIEAAEAIAADIIVRTTGDNPLTDPVHIDKMIKHHIETGAEYTYVEGLPEGTKPEIISVSALKKCWELADNPGYSEYMTLYFKNSGMFKVAKMTADPEVSRPNYRLTVDTPEDLKLMREIYKRLYLREKVFNLREVIKLLDDNPELAKINAYIKPKEVKMKIIDGKMRIVERG